VMDVEEELTMRPPPPKPSKKEATAPPPPPQQQPKPQSETRMPEPRAKDTRRSPSPAAPVQSKKEAAKRRPDAGSSPEPERREKKTLLERTNEEIAAVKASMKRTIHSEPVKEKKKSALEQLIPETAVRGRKRRPGGTTVSAREEQEAIDLLKSFRSKLEHAPTEKSSAQPAATERAETADAGQEEGEGEVCDLHFVAGCQSCKAWDKLDEKEDSDDEGWMSHTLSFAADKLGKDLSYRKKAEEELVVIDPLAKARTLQEEKKASKDARSGNSSRAWDRGRERRDHR